MMRCSAHGATATCTVQSVVLGTVRQPFRALQRKKAAHTIASCSYVLRKLASRRSAMERFPLDG